MEQSRIYQRPFDALAAAVYTILEGFSNKGWVHFTRRAPEHGLVQYQLSHPHLGEIGKVRIRMLHHDLSELLLSLPPIPPSVRAFTSEDWIACEEAVTQAQAAGLEGLTAFSAAIDTMMVPIITEEDPDYPSKAAYMEALASRIVSRLSMESEWVQSLTEGSNVIAQLTIDVSPGGIKRPDQEMRVTRLVREKPALSTTSTNAPPTPRRKRAGDNQYAEALRRRKEGYSFDAVYDWWRQQINPRTEKPNEHSYANARESLRKGIERRRREAE